MPDRRPPGQLPHMMLGIEAQGATLPPNSVDLHTTSFPGMGS